VVVVAHQRVGDQLRGNARLAAFLDAMPKRSS
jgi:hypothetical protein